MPIRNGGVETSSSSTPELTRRGHRRRRPAVPTATVTASSTPSAGGGDGECRGGRELLADDLGDRALQQVGAAEVAAGQPPQVVEVLADAPAGPDPTRR